MVKFMLVQNLMTIINQKKFLSLEVKHKKLNVYAIDGTVAMINIIEQLRKHRVSMVIIRVFR